VLQTVHSLTLRYLRLAPSLAWHARFVADCQTILATILAYANKLPAMGKLEIPRPEDIVRGGRAVEGGRPARPLAAAGVRGFGGFGLI
jgi:hypothetical protein